MDQETLLTLTADIVAAHVSNNHVAVGDVSNLVQRVHDALAGLGQPEPEPVEERKPAVSVRSSVKPDFIVCLVCGKKQKTLKRHLQSAHGMTPAEYRADYKLPPQYPMTAPDYAERRRALAHSIGLGRRTGPRTAKAASPGPKRQPRKGAGKPRAGRKPAPAAD